jgi:hypothetical protein
MKLRIIRTIQGGYMAFHKGHQHRIPPGKSGNPSGLSKEEHALIKQFKGKCQSACVGMIDDLIMLSQRLVREAVYGSPLTKEALWLVNFLCDRGFGKPKQEIEVTTIEDEDQEAVSMFSDPKNFVQLLHAKKALEGLLDLHQKGDLKKFLTYITAKEQQEALIKDNATITTTYSTLST